MAKMYLDPTSPIVSGSGSTYDAINDGVREPTTPTTSPSSEYVQSQDKGDKNEEESYGTENTTAVEDGEINWVKLWLYRSQSASSGKQYVDYDLRLNNVWMGVQQGSGSSGSWIYKKWDTSVVYDPLDTILTNNAFRFFSPDMANGDQTEAYAGAYLEIDYAIGGGDPPNPGGGSGPSSAFLLFLD